MRAPTLSVVVVLLLLHLSVNSATSSLVSSSPSPSSSATPSPPLPSPSASASSSPPPVKVVALLCRAGCFNNATCKDGEVMELDAFVCLPESGVTYWPYMRNFSSLQVAYSHGQWPTNAYYQIRYYVNGSCRGDEALRGDNVKLGTCGPANFTLQGQGRVYGLVIKAVPALPSPSTPSTPSPSATPNHSTTPTSLPSPSPTPSPSPPHHGGDDGDGFPVWAIVLVAAVGGAVVVAGLTFGIIRLAKRRSAYDYIA